MNLIGVLFVVVCTIALLRVPRRWAPLPLLVGCCYMTMGQKLELGPFSFPVYRILLGIGLLRILARGEGLQGGLNSIDKMVIGWAVWVFFANLFHEWAPGSGPVAAAGTIYNIGLIYFLIRIWCRDVTELVEIVKVLGLLLLPIAIEMLLEKVSGKNLFSVFGGVSDNVAVRDGRFRAQGPFGHAILAGTVGAVCFPLFVGIWNRFRVHAAIGIAAGLIMIFASASSGPVMSLAAAVFALAMWRFRHLTRIARIGAIIAYLVLMVVMSRPPYYLVSRIDIAGGSTGWHRAFLIEQTIKYLPEWWLFGTDHTRHWMPDQGIAWSEKHTDITNYYIGFGVFGGLLAMALLVAMILTAFRWVGQYLRTHDEVQDADQFLVWCLGAGMFSHAVTSFSVAYFDQSMVFFWLNIAVISSLHSMMEGAEGEEVEIDALPAAGNRGGVMS